MNIPGITITKSMLRIEAIKNMLKSFDEYCAKEQNPAYRNRAREALDQTFAKLYENHNVGDDLEETNYLHHDD